MLERVGAKVVWLALVLQICACQAVKVEELPSYHRAVALPSQPEVRSFVGNSIDPSAFPAMVPYAVLSTAGPAVTSSQRILLDRATKTLAPDVILFHEGAPYYAGSVSTATAVPSGAGAIGIGFSSPTYETPVFAVCYRLAPAKIGVRWDETGMIVELSDRARSSGMLEGDRIVSINGSAVEFGPKDLRSAHQIKKLDLVPETNINLIWIRPGTGRMEGQVVAEENPPKHLEIPCLDLSLPPAHSDDPY